MKLCIEKIEIEISADEQKNIGDAFLEHTAMLNNQRASSNNALFATVVPLLMQFVTQITGGTVSVTDAGDADDGDASQDGVDDPTESK